MELAVHIADERDWTAQNLDVFLRGEDLFDLRTDHLDGGLLELLTLARPLEALIRIKREWRLGDAQDRPAINLPIDRRLRHLIPLLQILREQRHI